MLRFANGTRMVKNDDIYFVGNIENGQYIIVDEPSAMFIENLVNTSIDDKDELTENEKIILDTCQNLDLLVNKAGCDASENSVLKMNTAYFHVTDRCNYHCLGCYSDEGNERCIDKDYLSTKQAKELLDKLSALGVENLIISGGEPFLRHDLLDLLMYARKSLGFDKIIIGTNGSVLPKKEIRKYIGIVDNISVAIDGYDEKNSKFLRDGGSYEKSIDSIKYLRNNQLPVSMVATLHKKNSKYYKEYQKLSDELQVPLSFSLLTCSPSNKSIEGFLLDGKDMLDFYETVKNDRVLNAQLEDSLVFDDLSFKDGCGAGGEMISVSYDGTIYPCHMLHDPELALCNLLDESLEKVKEYFNNQKQFSVENVDSCKKCDYIYFCGGGCRARTWMYFKNPNNLEPHCELYKVYIKEKVNTLIGR